MSVAGDLQRLASLIRQLQGALGGNRIVRGVVNSSGAGIAGAGFTASRASAGTYTVTFSTAFASIPTVELTVVTPAQGIRIQSVSTTAVDLLTYTVAPVTLTDAGFHFTAIGPA